MSHDGRRLPEGGVVVGKGKPRMKHSFTFQAIETRYHGYHFRSRLEARWAVFFDTLGIEYEYEREGYSLEGIPYLPDFWLPEQEWWVEIKGVAPTPEELDKARLLALYTGKPVYTCSGNICFPDDPHQGTLSRYSPPQLVRRSCGTQDASWEPISTPPEVPLILQKISEAGLTLFVEGGGGEEKRLVLAHTDLARWGIDQPEAFFHWVQNQQHVMQPMFPLLRKHSQVLIEALTAHKGWENILIGQYHRDCFEWCECSSCGELTIHARRKIPPHVYCSDTPTGLMLADTPRLLSAYRAAREARF